MTSSVTSEADRVYTRVRALLRKAESTEFPAEAEALTAKAQDLLTRYSLDVALVEHGDSTWNRAEPSVRPMKIPGSYAAGRAMVLGAVASANRCTAVWDPQASTAMVVGFAVDLDAVDVLWQSLQAQAELAVAAAGPQVDHRGRSRTRSWRAAFWVAFGQRIGQRLTEQTQTTTDSVVADADRSHGEASAPGASLVPVLASRQRQVDASVDRHFPRLVSRRTRVSNSDGWSAGHEAANRARLHDHRPLSS